MGTEVYENPSDENLVSIDLPCSILKKIEGKIKICTLYMCTYINFSS